MVRSGGDNTLTPAVDTRYSQLQLMQENSWSFEILCFWRNFFSKGPIANFRNTFDSRKNILLTYPLRKLTLPYFLTWTYDDFDLLREKKKTTGTSHKQWIVTLEKWFCSTAKVMKRSDCFHPSWSIILRASKPNWGDNAESLIKSQKSRVTADWRTVWCRDKFPRNFPPFSGEFAASPVFRSTSEKIQKSLFWGVEEQNLVPNWDSCLNRDLLCSSGKNTSQAAKISQDRGFTAVVRTLQVRPMFYLSFLALSLAQTPLEDISVKWNEELIRF